MSRMHTQSRRTKRGDSTEADSLVSCADVRVHEFDPSWYTAVSFSVATTSLSDRSLADSCAFSPQKPYGALEPEED